MEVQYIGILLVSSLLYRKQSRQSKCRSSRQTACKRSLQRASHRRYAGHSSLNETEYRQGHDRNQHGPAKRRIDVMQSNIWCKRNEASDDVRRRDRRRAVSRPLWLRLFQAKFETHHEVDPGLRLPLQGIEYRSAFLLTNAISVEYFKDLPLFILDALHNLALFAPALAVIVLSIPLRRQISAKSHSDRAGRNLRRPCKHNQPRHAHSASQPGSERERHRQTIGHADHDVAYQVPSRKVPLHMHNIRMLMRHANKTS